MATHARDPEFQDTRSTLEKSRSSSGQGAQQAAESAARNFSIVLGGPVYDLLLRFRLVRQSLPNVPRRIVAMVAMTWLPLLLLSLKDGLAFGHQVRVPFVYDFSMYGRFLLGLPLLLLAEVVIDPAIRQAVTEFVDARLVQGQELLQFENILRGIQHLRDSWIPELILFVLAFFPVFLWQHEWTPGALSSWHTTARGLTAAGWWFAVFSAPLLRFIIYRWCFRYIIWAALLWRIIRLHLTLMPTHPDHAAGLNFLAMAQKHFGILFCALGCTLAGRVANSMVFERAPLTSFKSVMAGFVVMSLIVGLLPLTLLAPKLIKVRKAGLLAYGRLANTYTESFDRKWVHCAGPPSEPLLGTGDIQSLADMGNSFAFIEGMRIAPISRKLALQIAGQAAIPLVPLILLGTPAPELIRAVTKMVF
jgi:hypothetical protein